MALLGRSLQWDRELKLSLLIILGFFCLTVFDRFIRAAAHLRVSCRPYLSSNIVSLTLLMCFCHKFVHLFLSYNRVLVPENPNTRVAIWLSERGVYVSLFIALLILERPRPFEFHGRYHTVLMKLTLTRLAITIIKIFKLVLWYFQTGVLMNKVWCFLHSAKRDRVYATAAGYMTRRDAGGRQSCHAACFRV